MRLGILAIVFLIAFKSACSEPGVKEGCKVLKDNIKYDPEYFVLGTLSDYNGRFTSVGKGPQVDKYHLQEKPIVNYLTGYIKGELDITVDTISEKQQGSRMYSEELSKILNDLYGVDEKLHTDIFKTKHQIYSFLTGVYYRYGTKLDSSIYKIQIANSEKPQVCNELLKQIGCKNTYYKHLKNIPAQFIVYFEPSDTLKQYLYSIESEKVILKESHNNYVGQMMKDYISNSEMEKLVHKSNEKEVQEIRNVFER